MRVKVTGTYNKTFKYLKKIHQFDKRELMGILRKYGDIGVAYLSANTPILSGKTADSWYYSIESSDGGVSINWNNRNVNDGVNIAIILQYGHGTGTGGYVQGIDYINPAMAPIFDAILNSICEEVKNL